VPQEPCYPHYGGRGIALCDEWHDFGIFQKWAYENGYREDLTIDRINVNGNYEPSNCRWVDMFVQASNKTNNRSVSQYLPDGTYVATYKTLADARRATGTCEPNITKVCKGERPLANGFIWKYSEWKGETA
jgi:hypothetical protein